MNTKVGRNDPCPCGSGKKYKNCCLAQSKAPAGKKKFSAKVLSSPKTINLIERTYGNALEAAEKKEPPPPATPEASQ